MSESVDIENNDQPNGFNLIDKVAKETELPEDEVIAFMVNIIRAKKLDPKTLSLDELRESIINYILKLN
jgi:hypothetical protein